MATTNPKIYRGPVSTDAEVKVLMEKYSTAKPGEIVQHDTIEKLTETKRGTARYCTVVARWKRAMYEKSNLLLKARPGEGYAILSAAERVQKVCDDTGKVTTRLYTIHREASSVPRSELSKEDAKVADHIQIVSARMAQTLAKETKTIAPPSDIKARITA